MSLSYQEAHQRGIDTIAVWNQYAPAFTAGTLTVAQHTADVAEILTRAGAVATADSDLEQARDARDALEEALQQLCVQGPAAIEGGLPSGSDLQDDLHPIRAIKMASKEKTLERARKLHALWEKVNARHAAAVPVLPEQKAGGKTLAEFTTLMDNLAASLQTVADEESDNKLAHRDLDQITQQVDRQNKRWYKAWLGEYAEGTAERDALSQIDTGNPTAPPEYYEITTLEDQGGGTVGVSYNPEGGAHATTLLLLWRNVAAESTFPHSTELLPNGQTVSGLTPGEMYEFKTRAQNSTGSVDSPLVQVTLSN